MPSRRHPAPTLTERFSVRAARVAWRSLLWGAAIVLSAIVVTRVVGYEGRVTVVAAQSALGVVLLPAYGIALVAGLRRRRMLAVVALTVVAAHLAWSIPSTIAHPPAAAGFRMRLMTFNVRYANPHTDAVVAQLKASNADVIVVVELTRRLVDRLLADPVFARRYGEHVLVPGGSDGIGIWSRAALSDPDLTSLGGRPSPRVTVDVHGRAVRLWAVHTVAPVGGSRRAWRAGLARLRRSAAFEQNRRPRRPLVIAGDFNATGGNPSFARLLRGGFRDAHALAGRGWAATWPAGRRVPPFVRLDHVLVSAGIGVRRVGEGAAAGSDHRPVIADLTVAR